MDKAPYAFKKKQHFCQQMQINPFFFTSGNINCGLIDAVDDDLTALRVILTKRFIMLDFENRQDLNQAYFMDWANAGFSNSHHTAILCCSYSLNAAAFELILDFLAFPGGAYQLMPCVLWRGLTWFRAYPMHSIQDPTCGWGGVARHGSANAMPTAKPAPIQLQTPCPTFLHTKVELLHEFVSSIHEITETQKPFS